MVGNDAGLTQLSHCIELAAAEHRDEVAQYQNDLLAKNTDLTEQIHELAKQLSALTEEVHRTICAGGPAAAEPVASA